MSDATSVFLPHPDAAYRTIGGSVVIVHTTANRLIRLNETGSAVWKRLDGRSVADISREIAEEFEVETAQAERDALAFLEQMRERGLVALK